MVLFSFVITYHSFTLPSSCLKVFFIPIGQPLRRFYAFPLGFLKDRYMRSPDLLAHQGFHGSCTLPIFPARLWCLRLPRRINWKQLLRRKARKVHTSRVARTRYLF